MEEYLDIVDENGNLTGEKELRSVVHEKGLWHRVAIVYFYRKKENKIEFLVHLRSAKKDAKPSIWDPKFGGHVKTGQSIETALAEEVKEETGLDIASSKFIKGITYEYRSAANKELASVYYYSFEDNIETLSLNEEEVQEVKWMNTDDIIKAIIECPEKMNNGLQNFKIILNDLQKKLK